MKKPLILLFLSTALAASLSCGQQKNSALSVSINPNNPILVPYGETTNGSTTVTAPYFKISTITLSWNGTDTVDIQAIIIKLLEAGSTQEQTCSLGGDDLKSALGGDTTMAPPSASPGATPTTKSTTVPLYCNVTVADKDADRFNIRGTVRVAGSSYNGQTTTGRASATAAINVQ